MELTRIVEGEKAVGEALVDLERHVDAQCVESLGELD